MKYKIISDCWVRGKPISAGSNIELDPSNPFDLGTLKDLAAAGRVAPIDIKPGTELDGVKAPEVQPRPRAATPK